MNIFITCPVCKETKEIELTREEFESYLKYKHGEGLIQNMLPNIERSIRELLKGGMCGSCWESLFGKPPWENGEENKKQKE